MEQQTIGEHVSLWLEPAGRRLRRAVDRSQRLRLLLLGIASASGGILMLSPATIMVCAAVTVFQLGNHIQGPLDWLLVVGLVTAALFAGFISFQLYLVRPALPAGIELAREREPALFAMLERRVSHFGVRPINRVVLSTSPRLTIDATPRLPLPFLHTYTLCLGAPLMFFLSHGQFRLALAGAIATRAVTQKGRWGWIAQSAQDWPRIAQALEHHPSFSSGLFIRSVRLIATVTAALGSELSTEIEQAQGRWVRDNADEQAVIEFLARQVVACAFLDKLYWPMIYKAAHGSASPVVHPFSHLPLLLTRLLENEQPKRWLLQAQASSKAGQTGLRDILASLNLDHLSWPGLPEKNAFSSVFQSPDLLKQLDNHWQQRIAPDWERRYKRFQHDKKRFERLHHEASAGTLHVDSAARYVKLAKRFLDKADVVRAYLLVYQSNINNPGLCMLCGQELLAAGESRDGYAALQRASELQPTLASRAQTLMEAHREAWLYEQQATVKQAHNA